MVAPTECHKPNKQNHEEKDKSSLPLFTQLLYWNCERVYICLTNARKLELFTGNVSSTYLQLLLNRSVGT
jgi:hypothetical protein